MSKRTEWGRRALLAAAVWMGAGGASAVAVSGSGSGGGIPDGSLAGVLSTIVMPGTAGTLSSLSISVAVTHSWVGDLVFQLEHNGRVLTLLDRPGQDPATAEGAGFAADLSASAPLVFNAAGTAEAETIGDGCSANQTVGISAGCLNTLFRPQQSFALYADSTVGGNWTLGVFDHYRGDAGTLAWWTINADVTPPSAPVPEPASGVLLLVGVGGLLLHRRFGPAADAEAGVPLR